MINNLRRPKAWRLAVPATVAVAASFTGVGVGVVDAAAEPVQGGTLTIGRPADLVSIDGNVLGEVQHVFSAAVYNTLIELDDSLEPQPELAESWTLTDDGAGVTFTLRDGVTFHDGKPLTSADVAFTVERVRDPEVGSPQLATFSGLITEVSTPDELTVELSFERPLSNIFDFFELLYIVDENTVEGSEANRVANGTGPFMLDEWQPERSYTLERNPEYWEEGLPHLDRVEVQIVPDAQGRVAQLESGQLDAITEAPPAEVQRLEDSGFSVVVTDPFGSFYIAANVNDPAVADARVRQAINHAIDRDRFVEQTLFGVGDATALAWPLSSPAYDEELDETIQFDLDEARRLLDEAGVDSLELQLWNNGGQAPLVDFGQILQADLASIGVALEVNNPEVPRWRELFAQADYPGLISGPYGASNLTPASLFMLAKPFNPAGNVSNFASDEYTALLDNMLAATDEETAAEATRSMNEFLLEESFIMPIATANQVVVSSDSVQGWGERRGNGGFDLREVFIAE